MAQILPFPRANKFVTYESALAELEMAETMYAYARNTPVDLGTVTAMHHEFFIYARERLHAAQDIMHNLARQA